jgi:hypothetical protein
MRTSWLRLPLYGLLALGLSLSACDSAETNPNDDIPADPDVAPPAEATGSLIPSIALDEIDPSNPDRIPLVIGGVAYDAGGLSVVDYDEENLTVVVDGRVQGKKISESSAGLRADIVFVIDNTGSMGGAIFGVRESVLSFIGAIEASGQDIRAGVVAYNDNLPETFESGVPVTDTRAHAAVYGFVDLTSDFAEADTLYQFIENLPATGGGDGPELAIGGLDYARRAFSWRPGAQQIYIVITDVTTWGGGYTSFPNSKGIDAGYPTAEELARTVRDEGGVIHTYSPDNGDDPFFSDGEHDVRDFSTGTGGIWTEFDFSGGLDLTTLGIIETTLASSRVEFVRDSDGVTPRTVRVVVRVEEGGEVFDGERTVTLTF